ncbi:flavin reductase family protein [Rhodococcus sp. HNM0569]|uniref:flavin reductase family protein n=1 Tax=Rhodococcus sp. HNM0569 TaxID=2716340 RepID=UPI00146BBA10|nr:flavin reductase family protein [Rhodococcus sp. HNM0569]NLU83729.1 flavin reductase [Rhodococcus sp. HNM0569]
MTAHGPAEDEYQRITDMLDSPVYIVTTAAGTHRAGCVMTYAMPASIGPHRFLAAISRANHTFTVASQARYLAVHVLRDDQCELAELFGAHTGDVMDKFAQCRWRPGPGGVPILDDVAGWFCGAILERVPLGDHVGCLLQPIEAEVRHSGTLLGAAAISDLTPGHPA